ncbi:MAG: nucleotidyltransferase domain-containing protein [Sulfuritalea sp.]|nr:nucleotidyltransferase domain-containing protein [Sulfuritalea sp.]
MRLTPEQIRIILNTVHAQAGPAARVVVFGSRLDDRRRGGDLDLLIESSPALDLIQRARIKRTLESQLRLPVDILAKRRDAAARPFQAIALATGIPL